MELTYAFQNRDFGGLPEAGGLRNQPARLMLTMSACLNMYNAVVSYESLGAGEEAEWAKRYPHFSALIDYLDNELRPPTHHS